MWLVQHQVCSSTPTDCHPTARPLNQYTLTDMHDLISYRILSLTQHNTPECPIASFPGSECFQGGAWERATYPMLLNYVLIKKAICKVCL